MSDTIAGSTASSTATRASFEDATRTVATTSRCGTPDPEIGAAFVTRCAWPTANLTYAFDIGTTDVETRWSSTPSGPPSGPGVQRRR